MFVIIIKLIKRANFFAFQEASVVDCMCVWLYASLGTQVMEKAIAVLGSKLIMILTVPPWYMS